MVTNLDADGQRTAIQALAGRAGSVVAIEPQTGQVRVMVSIPDYDPNQVPDQLRRAQPRGGLAAPQPRHAGPLPAGLDLQGGDRGRGARHRQVQPQPVS